MNSIPFGWFILIGLMLLVAGAGYSCFRKSRLLGWLFVGIVVALLAALTIWVWPFSPVGKPLLVTSTIAPDGTQMQVTQIFTGTGEPYQVAFYCRHPGQPWGWYYIDHEDVYWRSARISIEPATTLATLWRGHSRIATFDWKKDILQRLDKDRVTTGPQAWRDPDKPW